MEFYKELNDIKSFTSANSSSSARNTFAETIEMQENLAYNSTPPVHSNPTVITAQPGQAHSQRRPIPISTLDWISTPRSQLSALSGTHFLGNVEQLEIQQIVDLSTLLGKSDKGLQYRVKVPKAETLFLAIESKSDNRSNILSCSRFIRSPLTLNILDQCGETAFLMKINFKWTYTLSRLHNITVTCPNLIGIVQENFSMIGPSFTVYDASMTQLCNIFGPNIFGCCMYKEAQFQVISSDGTHQIATLMHQWNNTLLDYTLQITCPAETDMKLKSLLLGAAFLMEYLYFERMKRTSRRIY